MSTLTETDREHARALAREHHAACVADGCQVQHQRDVWAVIRAHRAETEQKAG